MHRVKRIVIVTPDVRFGIAAKEALEKVSYSVNTFSSGVLAVDTARKVRPHLALIDFRIQDMPGTDMIDHMRTMRHDMLVIGAPDHPAVHKLNDRYRMYSIINLKLSMPDLVNLIDSAFNRAPRSAAPNPRINATAPDDSQSLSSPLMLEFWLAEAGDGKTIVETIVNHAQNESSTETSSQSIIDEEDGLTATGRFRLLEAEEPPPPTFAAGGTISELRKSLTSVSDIQATLSRKIVEDDAPDDDADDELPDTGSTPAAQFLATATDESTPIKKFSLAEFMRRVDERAVPGVQPLPSWLMQESDSSDSEDVSDSEQVAAEEPSASSEQPSPPSIDELLEYTATVTMSMRPIVVDPQDLPTDPIEPVRRSRPPQSLPEVPSEPIAAPLDDDEAKRHSADLGSTRLPPSLPEVPPITLEDSMPFTHVDDTDPELAQLATTLIQIALNVTADATVLAHDGRIIAYAGRVTPEDIDALRHELTITWDQSTNTDKSRILFANVPASNAEYMISTRGTDGDFTLSLIFSGTRPLHEIRRQSKLLVAALESVPQSALEQPAEVAEVYEEDEPTTDNISVQMPIPSTQEIGVRDPIALLWLLRDPDGEIDNNDQRALLKALDTELTGSGWKLHDLQAPDYVYLYGDMPANKDPRDVIKHLMALSESVMSANKPANGSLWDDSYLIVQPGRELSVDEIQRFITFARR